MFGGDGRGGFVVPEFSTALDGFAAFVQLAGWSPAPSCSCPRSTRASRRATSRAARSRPHGRRRAWSCGLLSRRPATAASTRPTACGSSRTTAAGRSCCPTRPSRSPTSGPRRAPTLAASQLLDAGLVPRVRAREPTPDTPLTSGGASRRAIVVDGRSMTGTSPQPPYDAPRRARDASMSLLTNLIEQLAGRGLRRGSRPPPQPARRLADWRRHGWLLLAGLLLWGCCSRPPPRRSRDRASSTAEARRRALTGRSSERPRRTTRLENEPRSCERAAWPRPGEDALRPDVGRARSSPRRLDRRWRW